MRFIPFGVAMLFLLLAWAPAYASAGHYSVSFAPPYANNWGTFATTHPEWSYGNCVRSASVRAIVSTGRMSHTVSVKCDADLFGARAWSEGLSRLRGPRGNTFSVGQSGYYEVSFEFTGFTGEARTAAQPPLPWGAARATGYVAIRIRLWQSSPEYLVGCYGGLSKCVDYVLYSRDSSGTPYRQTWLGNGYWLIVSGSADRRVYLTANTLYHFDADLYASHRASVIGISVGGSWSSLGGTLSAVYVTHV